jgi:hypothetical protein
LPRPRSETSQRGRVGVWFALFEDVEIAEQPPQDQKDQDSAEAATTKLLGTKSSAQPT